MAPYKRLIGVLDQSGDFLTSLADRSAAFFALFVKAHSREVEQHPLAWSCRLDSMLYFFERRQRELRVIESNIGWSPQRTSP